MEFYFHRLHLYVFSTHLSYKVSAKVKYSTNIRVQENTLLVTKLVSLTPVDVASFRFQNKAYVKRVNYIVRSMKLALMKDQKVIPAQLELWRVSLSLT